MARQFGYDLPSFWPDEANSIESIHRGNPRIGGVLASFIGSTGHRNHLMGQGWYATHREIGVGARLDDRTWTVLTATTGSGELFLTGVAYADADGNGRMDLGEGLSRRHHHRRDQPHHHQRWRWVGSAGVHPAATW